MRATRFFRQSLFACFLFVPSVLAIAGNIPRTIDLDNPLVTQYRIAGVGVSDAVGRSVDWAGDFNDDGFDDILIGAFRVDGASGGDVGAAYLVFGGPDRFGTEIDVDALDGSNGFRFLGRSSGDTAGERVAGIGDINDDGLPDVAIGAYRADPSGTSGAGEVYVLFGSDSAWPANLGPDDLNGSNGFVLTGVGSFDQLGRDLAAAGDVNDDGIDDLIVGADGADAAYVILGRSTAFPASLSVADLSGSDGFRLDGPVGETGRAVAGLGDFDGDGIDDIAVAAPAAQPGGVFEAGSVFVVFGRDTAFPASLDVEALDGSDGFRIDGETAGLELGHALAGVGDVNSDGRADLAFTSLNHDEGAINNAGIVFLVFGGSAGGQPGLALSALDGSNGGRLLGTDTDGNLGRSVAPAGDFNRDGHADWLAAADRGNPLSRLDAGEVAIVYGGPGDVPASRSIDALDGDTGLVIAGAEPGNRLGFDMGGGGDLDADGRVDVLLGAPFADPGGTSNAGTVVVVSGRNLEPLFSDRFEASGP